MAQFFFGGYSIAITLVAIMVSVAGIIFGIGYSMDDRRLKELGRAELYQAIINGVIVGSLLLAFGTNGIVPSLMNSSVSNLSYSACPPFMQSNKAICFANDYLVGAYPVTISGKEYPSISEISVGLLLPLATLYTLLSVISSIKLNLDVAVIGFSGALSPLLSQMRYVMEAITFAIIGVFVQDILLKFIAATAVPVLLPLGILLRTFYFTRRLGGTIIAIAIGLFAVFPLTYLLDANLVTTYASYTTPASVDSITAAANGSSASIIGSPSLTGNAIGQGVIGQLTGALSSLIQSVEGLIQSLLLTVAMLVVEVFFLPVFSIILTTVSVRELARILGSEVSFARFDVF